MTKIRVYTDGGCLKNKIGGAGFVIVLDNPKKQKVLAKRAEIYEDTTSNKMELQAMINATHAIKTFENDNDEKIDFSFYSDSSYVIKGINNNWYDMWQENNFKKKNGYPVKNLDLWKELTDSIDNLYSIYGRVKFIWVRGKDSQGDGNGDIYNEMVDELVTNKLKEYENGGI